MKKILLVLFFTLVSFSTASADMSGTKLTYYSPKEGVFDSDTVTLKWRILSHDTVKFQSTPPRRGRLYIFFPLFLSYFTTYFPRTLILCICFVSICYILTKDMLILCNIKRIADLLEFFRLLKVREASPFEAYYRISGPSGS